MEPFRNRVATNVVPVEQRDPRAFQSGIGEGLQELGKAAGNIADNETQVNAQVAASEQRIALIEKQRAQSARISTSMGNWADTMVQLETKRDELRNKPDVLPTFAADSAKLTTDTLTTFLDQFKGDPEVYDHFAPMVADYGARARIADADWARKQQAVGEAQGLDKWVTVKTNTLLTTPANNDLLATLDQIDAAAAKLDAPDNVRDAWRQGAREKAVGEGYFQGLINGGKIDAAQQLIESGKFDPYLGDGKKQQLIARIGNARDQATREAAIAENKAKAQAADALKAAGTLIEAGGTPSDKDLDAAETAARATGVDASDMAQFAVRRVQVSVNRSYGGLVGQPGGAAELRRTRDALAAKIAGGKGSESDGIVLKQLDGLVGKADTQATDQFKGVVEKGPQAVSAAIGTLTGGDEQRYEQAEKIDKGLGWIALLPRENQGAAVNGRALIKARPNDFGSRKNAEETARTAISQRVAATLGDKYDSVVDTAWAYMANEQSRRGETGFNQQWFTDGLRFATGATKRAGTNILQGGLQPVRGKQVLLPDSMTAPEFDAAIARADFGGAVYANKQPVDHADVLANYVPTYSGDDDAGRPFYYFVDAQGGRLMGRDNRPFKLIFKGKK